MLAYNDCGTLRLSKKLSFLIINKKSTPQLKPIKCSKMPLVEHTFFDLVPITIPHFSLFINAKLFLFHPVKFYLPTLAVDV